jgi:hypothetical protein
MSGGGRYKKGKKRLFENEYSAEEVKSLATKLDQWGAELSLAERQLLHVLIARAASFDKNEHIVFFDKSIKERTAEALKPFTGKTWALGTESLRADLVSSEDDGFWVQWAQRKTTGSKWD